MYKILTSIIAERTYTFLSEHQLLPSEQKGCKRGSYGCKDQLLINKMILEDCKTKKKNLSTAWIDYKKAFDSVPHTWIIKCMEIYKICPVTVNFITESMKCWKTTLHLNHAEGSITSRPINIKSGIFQGDSLSTPILSCPRSTEFITKGIHLCVDESDGIQHAKMKEKVRKEYYRRVRMVLKTELNAANRFEAINTLAIPVVTYSFNIIDWKMSEIKRLDTKTRKLLTLSKMHHTKADVDRLYLPRNAGGRGLIQLEASYKTTTIGLDTYLKNTDDALIKLVQEHDGRKKLYSIQKQAEQFKQELDLQIPDKQADETTTKYAKITKQMARNKAQEKLTKQWEDKALHGRYPKRINEADVYHHETNQWLKSSGL
ncbi:hypothetical protein ACROYT_G001355 [Oculina patagonica]